MPSAGEHARCYNQRTSFAEVSLYGKYQDSMRICQEYWPPTFFITLTGTPNWKQIQSNLAPGMKAEDRPNLVARVFKQKFDTLMDCLIKCKQLGTVVSHMAVVEWRVLLLDPIGSLEIGKMSRCMYVCMCVSSRTSKGTHFIQSLPDQPK